MNHSVEQFIASYRQLALVSAVLGGFAFSFLAVHLAAGDRRRIAGWTISLSSAAALLLVVTAFLDVSFGASLLGLPAGASFADLPATVLRVAGWSAVTFMAGVASLVLAVMAGGFLRSTSVGWIATLLGLGALGVMGYALSLLGLV
jgi:hypothetical protein